MEIDFTKNYFTKCLPGYQSMAISIYSHGRTWLCYNCGYTPGVCVLPHGVCTDCKTDLRGKSREDSFVEYMFQKEDWGASLKEIIWQHPLASVLAKNAQKVFFYNITQRLKNNDTTTPKH